MRSSGGFHSRRDGCRWGVAPFDTRWRITWSIIALVGVLFVAASIVSLIAALETRRQTLERMEQSAYLLTESIDLEVQGLKSLLAGLSSSPLLHQGNLEAFDRQLKATPIAAGTWIVLFDEDRVALHTRFPYGSDLPAIRSFAPGPQFFPRLRRLGSYVSGRFRARVLNASAVTINLVPPPTRDGRQYYLATVLTDGRLADIIRRQRLDPRFDTMIVDQVDKAVVDVQGSSLNAGVEVPGQVLAALKGSEGKGIRQGRLAVDAGGEERIIFFVRSNATTWRTLVSVDRAALDAPVRELALRLLLIGLMIAALSAIAVRQLRRDVGSIEDAVADIQHEVVALSMQLQQSQDAERARIAREMHDSTVQHLAGAMLQLQAGDADRVPLDQARQSIARAIEELRTFSFALMPQDLGDRRFSTAVQQFAIMVNRRAGLEVTIDLAPEADRLSPALQQALLRIIQEALTNVLRHAQALKVTVELTLAGSDLLLVIADSGVDRPRRSSQWFEDNAGVGMAAMRSRLVPFDGQLTIEGTGSGTRVRVVVPRVDLGELDQPSAA